MKLHVKFLGMTGLLLLIFTATSCKKDFERLLAVQTTGINRSTYTVSGAVIDVGESTPSYGFCYGTTPNPTLSNAVVTLGKTSSPNTFQKTLTDLSPGSTYYVRSYVQGEQGTVYGEVLSFEVTGNEVEYIYDDGTYDYGWRINSGYTARMGNYFPVGTYGAIRKISVYFRNADGHGSDQLSIDVYNASQTLVGSTILFTPPTDDWITISGLNINFSGGFYVMVLWDNLAGTTNYLGEDQDGSNAYLDLAYMLYNGGWSPLSSDPNGNQLPGNFMVRVTANLSKANGKVVTTELDPSMMADEKCPIPGPSYWQAVQPSISVKTGR
jgi:hypothetical protein